MPGVTSEASLTVQEAADREGVDPETVGRWIRIGIQDKSTGGANRLAARKKGGRWRINPTDLDEFSRRLTEAALSK